MASVKETTNVNFRVETGVKREAEAVLKELGMNLSTALNVFMRQVIKKRGIPFEMTTVEFSDVPTRRLERALKETEKIVTGKKKVKSYNTTEEMWKDLGYELKD